MLKIIRRKVGWTLKITLGLIAITFVLYFGFNSMQSQKQISIALKVGSEEISIPKYQLFLDREYERLKNQLKEETGKEAEIPDFYRQIATNSTRQRLTFRSLMQQFAEKIGFKITDLEIAQFVSQSPNFDPVEYKRFLNNFFMNTRVPYEELIREDIVIGNFQQWSERVDGPRQGVEATDPEPTWTFETLTLKSGAKKDLAEKIQKMWHTGGDAKRLLTQEKLTLEKTGPLILKDRHQLLFGQLNLEEYQSLLSMKSGFAPEKPIQKGETYYLLRLVERKIPKTEKIASYQPKARLVDLWFNQFAKETPTESFIPENQQ